MPSRDRRDSTIRSPAGEHFAALQRQAGPRRWLTAIMLSAATGLLANLILDWSLTSLVATLTLVGLLLWDHHHGTLASWWPTDQGLHRLAASTAHLERHGWTILPIPSPPPRNTHLLIGPGGVVVVEHQIWTITDTITTHPRTGLLHVGTRLAAQRIASARATATTVQTALANNYAGELSVRAVLAVDGKPVDEPHTVAGVTIMATADLARLLRRSCPVVLKRHEIVNVADIVRHLSTLY